MPEMIDKEQAIKILCDGCTADCDIPYTACITVRKIIDMPTIEAESNQWISVKDRLPKDYESVLIYFKEANQIREATKVPSGWYCGQIVHESKITHWTPIPKPPKE